MTSFAITPALGDIVVSAHPVIHAIELLGSWRARQVRWFRHDDRELRMELLDPLEHWKIKALRIIQVILFPLALLCILLKALRRLKKPIHNLNGLEIVMPTKEFLENACEFPHEAILVIGCTGSGKSRVTERLMSSLRDKYILLDADVLMENVPEYIYEAERGLDQAANHHHQAGSRLRDLQFKRLISFKSSMVLETTSNQAALSQWVIPPLKNAGYRIKLVYVETDLENCIKRANQRSRKVPKDFIVTAHQATLIAFDALKLECDEWCRYDNNGSEPTKKDSGKKDSGRSISIKK